MNRPSIPREAAARLRTPALAAIALAAALAACTSTPLDPNVPAPVVTRSAAATTWASPNAGSGAPPAATATPTAPQSRVATVDTSRGVPAAAAAAAAGATAPVAAAIAAPSLRAPAERLVFFDYDSFAIRDEFKAMLEGHAKVLAARRDQRLTIEGHTDERGGREYNLALGQKRAEAVLRSLTLLGASESQIEAVSFGKERLVNTAGTETAMAQNRRAELKDR
ncbi:MAG: OmpA family protein [Rubrivivax sp.]|jgi:peptidoglycan-associated lipoprotein|nr:OmpA family protein [Rubrivivax sp.]